MKRYLLLVTGKVQGVSYREFAVREAQKNDIVGYVKNRSDGAVEITAQGEEDSLRKFIAACKKGPLMAFVQKLEAKEEQPTDEFEDFNVRY